MRKKVVSIFMLIILVLTLSVPLVKAEELTNKGDLNTIESKPEEENTSWPKKFIYQEYEYSIEGIDLYVYEIDDSKTKTEEKEENGVTVTVTTNEDAIKYIKEEPTKVIKLDPKEFTISPEYKEEKLNGYDTMFIDLNLNITKEKLKELLNTEYEKTTKTINYMIDMNVRYKIIKYPEIYKHFMKVNTFRTFFGIFTGDMTTGSKIINPQEENYQTINTIQIGIPEETNEKTLMYENVLNDENEIAMFILNYTALSSKEINIADKNSQPDKLIMFHNVDNIEYLIENFNKVEDDANQQIEEIIKPEKDQYVNIPDTAAKISVFVYIISVTVILIGAIVIIKVTSKKGKIKA